MPVMGECLLSGAPPRRGCQIDAGLLQSGLSAGIFQVSALFLRGLADAVENEEADRFLDPHAPLTDAAILQNPGDRLERALVLLPNPDIRAHLDKLPPSHIFKARHHARRLPAPRR